LTKCPGYFNFLEKIFFYIYKLTNDPSKYLKNPKKYFRLLLKILILKVLFFKNKLNIKKTLSFKSNYENSL